jgi:hypothetical protein
MKIRSVEAELFHSDRKADGMSDRRTADMARVIVTFRNFANADKNIQYVML